MTTLTITPESLKSAAKAIRALVRERTGQDIPHSSALNALVAGLGLAKNHGALMASLAQEAPAAAPVPTTAGIQAVLVPKTPLPHNWTVPSLSDPDWTIDIMGSDAHTHGLWLSRKNTTPPADGTNPAHVLHNLRAHADIFQKLMAHMPQGTYLAATNKTHRYAVDFIYTSTHQLCTALVNATLWDTLIKQGCPKERALFALAEEIEMADESTAVLDVRAEAAR